MIDLETMSTSSNAAIVSIGAVKFDNNGLGDTFYCNVDLASSVQQGGEIDANTVMWWLSQSSAARGMLINDVKAHINSALLEFNKWLEPNTKVWGNGVDFDNVILANAYKRSSVEMPWKYYNNRCYRTIKNIFDPKSELFKRIGEAHNALDDAKSQVEHLLKICEAYSISL